jgi:hypothetical protein
MHSHIPCDEDIATNDISISTPVSTSTIPFGPITRARARRLTHQVSSLLSSGSSYLENEDMCTLVLLRNITQEQWIGSKGKRHRAGWIRTAGKIRLVTAATTSSGLHFGRSSTFWKAYQIYFPIDPESPKYLFGVNRNPRFTTESFSVTVLRHPNFAQRALYQVESKSDAS